MKHIKNSAFAVLLFLFVAVPAHASETYIVKHSDTSYEDVVETLKMSIEERGLYINNIMHMAEMLERTGKDLGFDKPLLLKAESIEFCSAVLSRKMITENPARVVNCPFIISIYVLPEDPEKTYVAYKNLLNGDSGKALTEVSEMLNDLAEAAVAGW